MQKSSKSVSLQGVFALVLAFTGVKANLGLAQSSSMSEVFESMQPAAGFLQRYLPQPSQPSATTAALPCSELDRVFRKVLIAHWSFSKLEGQSLELNCEGGIAQAAAQAYVDFKNVGQMNREVGVGFQLFNRQLRVLKYEERSANMGTTWGVAGRVHLGSGFLHSSREDRAATLMHEGGHLGGEDPGHVTCSSGKYAGTEGACDARFHGGRLKGSGYNRDVIFYAAVIRGKRSALSRSVNQMLLADVLLNRFNSAKAAERAQFVKLLD